jgi:hypothetical protein
MPLILGDKGWQERWRCWNRTNEDGTAVTMWCESCAEQRAVCDKWPDDMRRRARYLANDPDIRRLAKRYQPESLTDEMVSLLEVKWALDKLKEAEYRAWKIIQWADLGILTPNGKVYRRSMESVARSLGCHRSTAYEDRKWGWDFVTRQIVDVIAPDVVERVRG